MRQVAEKVHVELKQTSADLSSFPELPSCPPPYNLNTPPTANYKGLFNFELFNFVPGGREVHFQMLMTSLFKLTQQTESLPTNHCQLVRGRASNFVLKGQGSLSCVKGTFMSSKGTSIRKSQCLGESFKGAPRARPGATKMVF